jgi:hypothetical protein
MLLSYNVRDQVSHPYRTTGKTIVPVTPIKMGQRLQHRTIEVHFSDVAMDWTTQRSRFSFLQKRDTSPSPQPSDRLCTQPGSSPVGSRSPCIELTAHRSPPASAQGKIPRGCAFTDRPVLGMYRDLSQQYPRCLSST